MLVTQQGLWTRVVLIRWLGLPLTAPNTKQAIVTKLRNWYRWISMAFMHLRRTFHSHCSQWMTLYSASSLTVCYGRVHWSDIWLFMGVKLWLMFEILLNFCLHDGIMRRYTLPYPMAMAYLGFDSNGTKLRVSVETHPTAWCRRELLLPWLRLDWVLISRWHQVSGWSHFVVATKGLPLSWMCFHSFYTT